MSWSVRSGYRDWSPRSICATTPSRRRRRVWIVGRSRRRRGRNDPDCPIKGMPSIRFEYAGSRESEADKTSGASAPYPSAIMKIPPKINPRRGSQIVLGLTPTIAATGGDPAEP